MNVFLQNVNAYLYGQGIKKTSILVKDGKIASIGPDITAPNGVDIISAQEDWIVVPGFLDQHVHGASGYDAMDASYEAIHSIATTLAKEGVTGFLATTITHHKEKIINALTAIKSYKEQNRIDGAEVLGVHLEGPFLSADYKGAHLPEYIVKPSIPLFEEYLEASGNTIKIVTLAPEESGTEFITYLKEKGIISSLGHTSGNYECMKQAVHAGASCMTHIYNAMKGFNHREVGAVGAGLSIDELATELIADGIHVSKEAINIVYRAKPKHKLILVTDAMRAKHMPDGRYELGGQEVVVEHGSARLLNGVLAGSILKLNDAVYNMSQFVNIKLMEAIDMASYAPALNLGLDKQKGKIQVGYDGDFAFIDTKMNVYKTIRAGNVIYTKE